MITLFSPFLKLHVSISLIKFPVPTNPPWDLLRALLPGGVGRLPSRSDRFSSFLGPDISSARFTEEKRSAS